MRSTVVAGTAEAAFRTAGLSRKALLRRLESWAWLQHDGRCPLVRDGDADRRDESHAADKHEQPTDNHRARGLVLLLVLLLLVVGVRADG